MIANFNVTRSEGISWTLASWSALGILMRQYEFSAIYKDIGINQRSSDEQ